MGRALSPAAGFLGAYYVLAAASHPFVVGGEAGRTLALAAAVSAVALFTAWAVLRRRAPVRGPAAQAAMAALIGVALANSALHLALVPEPRHSTNFLLLLAGTGFLVLSRGWFVSCVVVISAVWAWLAGRAPADPAWVHFAYAGVATAALAGVVHEMRLRSSDRVVQLLHLAEQRANEIAVRREAEAALREREKRLARFHATLLGLARHEAVATGELGAALPEITERATHALGAGRTAVWLLDEARSRLIEADAYDAAAGEHRSGAGVPTSACPLYLEALSSGRVLASDDASSDPRFFELAALTHLAPTPGAARLDAAVRVRGETVGVVVHEHASGARRWQPEETAFAGSVADMVALTLVARERSREVEEHRALERRMQDAQRLESLGVLAGGIAHDFNNLLTAILGSAELALLDLPADSAARAAAERIRRAGRRAADLTSQMLAYSGQSRMDRKPVDLAALLHDMADLLRSSLRKDARLHLELEADLPPVLGDGAQLAQIVMNLLTNASDALGPGGGEIRVRTGLERLDAETLRDCELHDAAPGEYVFLEVEDTGAGMDERTRARLFDPFFTTKSFGRGLGLAAALGIVAAHEGTIRLRSAPGRGTTFRVLLPRAMPGEAATEELPEPAAGRLDGRTVLVVDDEDDVRAVAAGLIERAGARAVCARDARRAIELLRERGAEIDAALVDLSMPDMNGARAAQALRAVRPGLPVILSSGYDRSQARNGAAEGIAGFVHKPYTAGELVAALRAALRADAGGGASGNRTSGPAG